MNLRFRSSVSVFSEDCFDSIAIRWMNGSNFEGEDDPISAKGKPKIRGSILTKRIWSRSKSRKVTEMLKRKGNRQNSESLGSQYKANEHIRFDTKGAQSLRGEMPSKGWTQRRYRKHRTKIFLRCRRPGRCRIVVGWNWKWNRLNVERRTVAAKISN
jgi:hypothetical protein